MQVALTALTNRILDMRSPETACGHAVMMTETKERRFPQLARCSVPNGKAYYTFPCQICSKGFVKCIRSPQQTPSEFNFGSHLSSKTPV
jgi:hypothetical protein